MLCFSFQQKTEARGLPVTVLVRHGDVAKLGKIKTLITLRSLHKALVLYLEALPVRWEMNEQRSSDRYKCRIRTPIHASQDFNIIRRNGLVLDLSYSHFLELQSMSVCSARGDDSR